ncbi:MAG: hypothetical protein Q9195_003053 [Heterodermia aff. obscurata]
MLLPTLSLIFFIPSLVSASPSNPANNRFVNSGSAPLPQNTSSSSNTTTTTPPTNELIIRCLPDHYGKNIPLSDCIDALQQISPGEEEFDWWQRHLGIRKEHFPLPFRFMGRESTFPYPTYRAMGILCGKIVQARCYIEPRLAPGIEKGVASLDMVSRAAAAIIEKCSTSGRRTSGGIAFGIGGNNALDVILSSYTGRAPACRGRIPDQPSAVACRAVLDDMEVSSRAQSWGPGAEVGLPAVVSSGAFPFPPPFPFAWSYIRGGKED